MQKKGQNRKMENEFFDFLKNYKYDPWNQYYIFSSYLSIYQSRTRYRRDWDSNPSKLKSLIPKWMGFFGYFCPLWYKGEKRYGEEEGTLKSQKGPRSIISLNHENFLSLIKVIKQKWKWMKILVDFFKIFFYDGKKNDNGDWLGIMS